MDILRLRQYLQALSQISYSYSQVNKIYSPLEKQSEEKITELFNFYRKLVIESHNLLNKYIKEEWPYIYEEGKELGMIKEDNK